MEDLIGYAARCSACGYEWWVIHADNLPMPLGGAARLMERAECPNCGNGGEKGQPLHWIARPPVQTDCTKP